MNDDLGCAGVVCTASELAAGSRSFRPLPEPPSPTPAAPPMEDSAILDPDRVQIVNPNKPMGEVSPAKLIIRLLHSTDYG